MNKDNSNQTFKWVNLSRINSTKILPISSYELITKDANLIKHSIEKI